MSSTTPAPAPAHGSVAAMSASAMAQAIADGTSTPSALLEEHLAVIAQREPQVRAWIHLDRDGARARARALDAVPAAGPLHGIPFGIKDNIDTCDMPTGYGSAIHDGFRPARDASCVAAMRLAGANPLGKTVSTEFAHRAPGATRNPHDPAHTPGGSSSGSAAAVACGMVPIAFGSQTTGSVIRPAAYCGVVGFKPTYGQFNPSGMLANTPSFDTLGVMARAVEDIALVRRALLDDSLPAFAPAALAGVRVGVCRTPWWDQASADAHALLEDGAAALARAGAVVGDFADNGAFDGLEQANLAVSGYEFARTLAHERLHACDRLSAVLRDGRMADGLRGTYAAYVAALQRLERARLQLDQAFAAVDLVLTLPAPGAAPAGLAATGSAIFNMPWTSLHTPAITVPVARDRHGLPLGLQLVAQRYRDDSLLALAHTVLVLLRD
jgi:amidase